MLHPALSSKRMLSFIENLFCVVHSSKAVYVYKTDVPRRNSRRSSVAMERAVCRPVPPPSTVTLMSPTLVTWPPWL